jgi:hypothetical protein
MGSQSPSRGGPQSPSALALRGGPRSPSALALRGGPQSPSAVAPRGEPRVWWVAPWLALLLVAACGRAQDHASALQGFLVGGPGPGTWEVQGLSTRRTTWIAPHPGDGAWLLKAIATTPGSAVRPCVALRGTVAREFLEAPWELFARNYFPAGALEKTTTREGVPARKMRWLPKHAWGETARQVWFDAESGEVLQIEDVAAQGQRVRGIYRTSAATGELDPDRFRPGGPGGQDICVQADPDRVTLKDLLDRAPFPLVAPTYLPRGYERIGARYEEVPPAPRSPTDGPGGPPDPDAGEPLRLASLLYSDGLGLISVGVAVRSDMDALQERLAALGPADGEPGGCSTLPPEQGYIAVGEKRLLRRRVDLCRTVLRLDGFEGVSVTLLSRNELPGDEYVKVMESLARVTTP